jgi:hypothetical protein
MEFWSKLKAKSSTELLWLTIDVASSTARDFSLGWVAVLVTYQ